MSPRNIEESLDKHKFRNLGTPLDKSMIQIVPEQTTADGVAVRDGPSRLDCLWCLQSRSPPKTENPYHGLGTPIMVLE